MKASVRTSIAITFLLLQLGSVVYARFTPRRYFCWAPNDYVVEYQIEVKRHGVLLSPQQVRERYLIDPGSGWKVEHPAEHLIDSIKQYEITYGRNDHAQVRLSWKYNGHPELRTWQWPQ
jgi:hypothetical protein